MVHCPACGSEMERQMPVRVQLAQFIHSTAALVCTRCPVASEVNADENYRLIEYPDLTVEALVRYNRPSLIATVREMTLRPANYLCRGES